MRQSGRVQSNDVSGGNGRSNRSNDPGRVKNLTAKEPLINWHCGPS